MARVVVGLFDADFLSGEGLTDVPLAPGSRPVQPAQP